MIRKKKGTGQNKGVLTENHSVSAPNMFCEKLNYKID